MNLFLLVLVESFCLFILLYLSPIYPKKLPILKRKKHSQKIDKYIFKVLVYIIEDERQSFMSSHYSTA